MIKEKLEDVSIKYLFIKKFSWNETWDKERFQGHPREGEVYRSIYNPKTNNNKLIINPPPGGDSLLLEDFKNTYEGEIIEITPQTLLECNLPEGNLDKLIQWLESENKDLKDLYQQPAPLQILQQAMSSQEYDEQQALNRAINILAELYNINGEVFDIVLALAEGMIQYTIERESDPTNFLMMGERGAAINIREAVIHLNRYVGPDRRTDLDKNDLYESIKYIIQEIERIKLNKE